MTIRRDQSSVRAGAFKPRTSPAEYVLNEGNEQVILCERGIRTFEDAYRYTLDLAAVPVLRERTHLPAAAAAGADGVMVEVHPDPDEALCDGRQSLYTGDFAAFAERVRLAAKELQTA